MLPPLPSMAFVRDVTIGEGESVPPLTDFTKTWTVMNTGNEPWPEGINNAREKIEHYVFWEFFFCKNIPKFIPDIITNCEQVVH